MLGHLSDADDVLTGQQPPLFRAKESGQKQAQANQSNETDKLLKTFREKLLSSSNPCDPEMMDIIKEIAEKNDDSLGDLISSYESLVQRSGSDFSQFRTNLVLASKHGFWAFFCTVTTALNVYQVAISKEAKKAITDITTYATELMTMVKGASEQNAYYQKTVEHAAVSWNATMSSMTGFMETVDKKMLDMSVPMQTQPKRPTLGARCDVWV